ncbi:MAG: formate/nitrite transporter family protein [Nitrospinaceae bacterium]
MFNEEIQKITDNAEIRLKFFTRFPGAYLILSGLAGVYVGFGIVLIFSLGGPLHAGGAGSWLKLVMGASFGVALSLVVFAGSELFTGNNLTLTLAALNRKIRVESVLRMSAMCYLGNLLGSVFLAVLVVKARVLVPAAQELVVSVSALKMTAGGMELFLRGILCNWLVCLAVWTAGRAKDDTAKLILIFWCLFAFIASGYEHCVANMTLLSLGLLLPHGPEVSLFGFGHNLLWVTLGNIVGGAGFVGMAYGYAGLKRASSLTPDSVPVEGAALPEQSSHG